MVGEASKVRFEQQNSVEGRRGSRRQHGRLAGPGGEVARGCTRDLAVAGERKGHRSAMLSSRE